MRSAGHLVARSLRKEFIARDGQSRAVLGGIQMSIDRGEVVCVVGRSGIGKTTLLNILAGILPPSSGTVIVGTSSNGDPSSVGYMSQKSILLPWMSIAANVARPLVLRGTTQREARRVAHEMLERVMLKGFESHYPHQISGGMARRACLARVLTQAHGALLLDEPFTGIDYDLELELESSLKSIIRATGAAALIVTHNIETAVALGDRVDVIGPAPDGAVVHESVPLGSLRQCDAIGARRHPDFGGHFARVLDAYRGSSNTVSIDSNTATQQTVSSIASRRTS